MVRRYALDAKPYTAGEFLQHYGEGEMGDAVVRSLLLKLQRRLGFVGYTRRKMSIACRFLKSDSDETLCGGAWLNQWLDSPLEKRLSNDRRAYTANQFSRRGRYEAAGHSSVSALGGKAFPEHVDRHVQGQPGGYADSVGRGWQGPGQQVASSKKGFCFTPVSPTQWPNTSSITETSGTTSGALGPQTLQAILQTFGVSRTWHRGCT